MTSERELFDCPSMGAKTDCELCPGEIKQGCMPAKRKVPTRCTITCMEPGCQIPIFYKDTDDEVPLYCEKHRTEKGKHAQVRILKKMEEIQPVIKKVIMICPKCKKRIIISEKKWIEEKVIRCPCGTKMNYHKDVK